MVLEFGSINDWVTVALHQPRMEPYAQWFDQAILKSKEDAMPALTAMLQSKDPKIVKAAAEMIAKVKSVA